MKLYNGDTVRFTSDFCTAAAECRQRNIVGTIVSMPCDTVGLPLATYIIVKIPGNQEVPYRFICASPEQLEAVIDTPHFEE